MNYVVLTKKLPGITGKRDLLQGINSGGNKLIRSQFRKFDRLQQKPLKQKEPGDVNINGFTAISITTPWYTP